MPLLRGRRGRACSSCAATSSTSALAALRDPAPGGRADGEAAPRFAAGRRRQAPTRFTLRCRFGPRHDPGLRQLCPPGRRSWSASLPRSPSHRRLEHFLRRLWRCSHRAERGHSTRPAAVEQHAARSRRPALTRATGHALAIESTLGGTLRRRSRRAGVDYVGARAGARFLANEPGLARRPGVRSASADAAVCGGVVLCSTSLKLTQQREAAHSLPHRSMTIVSGPRTTLRRRPRIRWIDYDVVHARRAAARAAAPRAPSCWTGTTTSRTRARSVAGRAAGSQEEPHARRAAPGAPPATPVLRSRRGADRAGAVLGRLERFGSVRRFARPLPGQIGGRAHPLALAPALLRAPRQGRRATPAAGEAPCRRACRRWTTSAEYRSPGEHDAPRCAPPLDLRQARQRRSPPRRRGSASRSSTPCEAARGEGAAALSWIEDFLRLRRAARRLAGRREVQDGWWRRSRCPAPARSRLDQQYGP